MNRTEQIAQERRLTRIESMAEETRAGMLIGLVLMLFGSYLTVKVPIDALAKRVDVQNGRVNSLESDMNGHEQRIVDSKPYQRLEAVEKAVGALAADARVVKVLLGLVGLAVPIVPTIYAVLR